MSMGLDRIHHRMLKELVDVIAGTLSTIYPDLGVWGGPY